MLLAQRSHDSKNYEACEFLFVLFIRENITLKQNMDKPGNVHATFMFIAQMKKILSLDFRFANTPSIPIKQVVLDRVWVKHWENKS